jgi:hypothetical protein
MSYDVALLAESEAMSYDVEGHDTCLSVSVFFVLGVRIC